MTEQEILQSPERSKKRIHVALPIRVTVWDNETRPGLEMACTYDISARGARVTGLRSVKEAGEIIAIERGRNNRFFCRVVWVGRQNSDLQGQIGIECVEMDRTLWEAELLEMEEVYDSFGAEKKFRPVLSGAANNKRRAPRFSAEGSVQLGKVGAASRFEGELKNISERGCLIIPTTIPERGSEVKLTVKVGNYDLTVKGLVKHVGEDSGVGIEFREIRRGDRQMLEFLLRKLAEQKFEEDFHLDVKSEDPSQGAARQPGKSKAASNKK